jgi:hypothetical protein
MNTEVQTKVESVICECIAGTPFEKLAERRGLSSVYVANQISALIGELCASDGWLDKRYVAEKARNATSQIESILESVKWDMTKA